MTLPSERTRAVIEMGRSVADLAPYLHGKSVTVRVPREALRWLHSCLRHYPMPIELEWTAEVAPHLWGPPSVRNTAPVDAGSAAVIGSPRNPSRTRPRRVPGR